MACETILQRDSSQQNINVTQTGGNPDGSCSSATTSISDKSNAVTKVDGQ
jgi:hypothetical protein